MPWTDACALVEIEEEDSVRLDHEGRTYAIYQISDEQVYRTDGPCTHEKVHLPKGLVIDHAIECPKHNGQFDVRTGTAVRSPACEALSCACCERQGPRRDPVTVHPHDAANAGANFWRSRNGVRKEGQAAALDAAGH